MRENHTPLSTEDCPAQLSRAADYIQDHLAEDLSLEKLASVACYSKYHFHRLFREQFGETINDYIRRVRLEQAARLLATDAHCTVSQISEACGFSSSQNFAKAFKAYFGMAPTLARRNPLPEVVENKREKELTDRDKLSWQVGIKDMPSLRVAQFRSDALMDADAQNKNADRLFQWAYAKGLVDASTRMIAIDRTDLSEQSSGQFLYDICVTVPEKAEDEDDVLISFLPACTCALLHCEEKREKIAAIRKHLKEEWLSASGCQPANRPFFVIFYNHPGMNPRGMAIMDLCLPVKT